MADNSPPLDWARIALELLEVTKKMGQVTAEIVAATNPEADKPKFIPNVYQKEILKALRGVAMRTDALAARVGSRARLFHDPGGIPELQEQGLVGHHPRLGFYSTSSPPPDLAE